MSLEPSGRQSPCTSPAGATSTSRREQLRSVRLARAHHELADAEAGQATVAEIASGWGFANPARFTADYGDRYGAPPWQTLRGPAYA